MLRHGNEEICEREASEASESLFTLSRGNMGVYHPESHFHYHRHAWAVMLANLSFLEAYCSPIGIKQPRIRQPLSHRVGPLVDLDANLFLFFFRSTMGGKLKKTGGTKLAASLTSVRSSSLTSVDDR